MSFYFLLCIMFFVSAQWFSVSSVFVFVSMLFRGTNSGYFSAASVKKCFKLSVPDVFDSVLVDALVYTHK